MGSDTRNNNLKIIKAPKIVEIKNNCCQLFIICLFYSAINYYLTRMDEIIINILRSKNEKYKKLSDILYHLFVNLAEISQYKYMIIGSYGMRNYRNISDLDISLDNEEFFKLKILIEKGYGKLEIHNNQIRWFYDLTTQYNEFHEKKERDFSIEAYQVNPAIGFPNNEFSLNHLAEFNELETDENGHKYFKIFTVLKWKKALGRVKDMADIQLVENVLKI